MNLAEAAFGLSSALGIWTLYRDATPIRLKILVTRVSSGINERRLDVLVSNHSRTDASVLVVGWGRPTTYIPLVEPDDPELIPARSGRVFRVTAPDVVANYWDRTTVPGGEQARVFAIDGLNHVQPLRYRLDAAIGRMVGVED